MANNPCIVLLDNGSTRAASILSLRRLSAELSVKTECDVHPVSLLHSDKIKKESIEGVPAHILESFLVEQRTNNENSFFFFLLFIGHSAAVFEYVPQCLGELRKDWPELEVRIAPCLVNLDDKEETDVADILARAVIRKVTAEGLLRPGIVLVDHGTPRIAVNEVRNLVCRQLKIALCDKFGEVKASSMERRPGREYDFNEPLLEDLLGTSGFDRDVVVALLFTAPGRHAGTSGDIERICTRAESLNDGLRIFISDLLTSDEGLVKLLIKRLGQGLSSEPVVSEVLRD